MGRRELALLSLASFIILSAVIGALVEYWRGGEGLFGLELRRRGEVAYKPDVKARMPTETINPMGRMVIFTASIALEVNDVVSTVERVKRIAHEEGGYVADSFISSRGGRKFAEVTIRVPEARFNGTIAKVKALGKLESEKVSGVDVTEQYVDLNARLSNLKAQEKRLLEILGMARTVEEVLKVEAQLERVRGEIERLIGQILYLERRVEMATITISLSEPAPPIKLPEFDWQETLRISLSILFTVVRGMIIVTFTLIPIASAGAPIYMLYRWRRRSRGAKL